MGKLAGYWGLRRGGNPIDAVEANALRGGRMTWRDGIAVVLPILASVGVGASVGTEAAVTQVGAVLASVVGQRIKASRSDLRLLVAGGAAAAISAAYRAPFAGMLYAFELVLGAYSKRTLPPVGVAAIMATLTVWQLSGPAHPTLTADMKPVVLADYLISVGIGVLAALVGIMVMFCVTAFERGLRRLFAYSLLRRTAVAVLLAVLSRRFPAVLGSGHAAIEHTIRGDIGGSRALGLLGAKGLASAASLGGGFRGGLFSASLLVGALLGQVVAWATTAFPGLPPLHPEFCTLVGMAGVGASIIGAPLAMTFLVLETTGRYDAALLVAIGAVTASLLTDRLFGYSFATWRFQQRGLAIEGGQDIARLSATPIDSLVRPPKRSVTADAKLPEVMRAISAAGAKGTAVYALDGSFAGLIDPSLVELMADEPDMLPVVAAELVHASTPAVTPQTTLAELIEIFRNDDRATLPVLDPIDMRELVGCVRARDAYALSSSVLDAQRRDDLGVSLRGSDRSEPKL
jgi:CIC family chloride channel protein